MMYTNNYHNIDISELSFLVTGGGGFIGSNLVEYLLKYDAKKVRVLDNFSNGYRSNLEEFQSDPAFELIEGDIRDDVKRDLDGFRLTDQGNTRAHLVCASRQAADHAEGFVVVSGFP